MDDRPWFASYPAEVPRSLPLRPATSLFALLESSAERFPRRFALSFYGRRLTYRDLLLQVERTSAGLTSLGVGKGDRVALLLPNCPQFVLCSYATFRLGAVLVGNNPLYTERELGHQLRNAEPRVAVVLDRLLPKLEAVREAVPSIEHVVVTGVHEYMPAALGALVRLRGRLAARGWRTPGSAAFRRGEAVPWKQLLRKSGRPPPSAPVDPESDLAALLYTGGTTGLSRGAMLSHTNLVTNCRQGAAWFPGLREGEEAILGVLPLYHAYALTVCMNFAVSIGAKLVLLPRFDVEEVLRTIVRERPTLFPGVPRIYDALSHVAEGRALDLSSIRYCLSGAARLPSETAGRFEALTGATVVEGYGLSEASPMALANPLTGARREGSIGLPLPDTDARVVDPDGEGGELAHGEPGELVISGPQVMMGYWRAEEETRHALQGGWLRTGDIVRMDEDGYFYLVDRRKDVIVVSGFKVYPSEVEEVLERHPKVARAAVVGVPHDSTEEAVKAFVVLRQGQEATVEELRAWCRDPGHGLAAYRVPSHVEFRESLLETPIGKVLRRALVEEEGPAAPPSDRGSP